MKKRYYAVNNNANPAAPVAPLLRQVHALFPHWVAAHYATRDFMEALAHMGDSFVVDYLMSGQPDCTADTQEALTLQALAVPTCLPVTQVPRH